MGGGGGGLEYTFIRLKLIFFERINTLLLLDLRWTEADFNANVFDTTQPSKD